MFSLKQFYRYYFNEKYFRDVRYIKDVNVNSKGVKSKYNTKVLKYPSADFKAWDLFLPFLINYCKEGKGSLIASLNYYRNFISYSDKDPNFLMCDKLFFDFDVENKKCKDLKRKIKDVKINHSITGRERVSLIREYQKDFRELILEEDLLLEPFNEVMKLKDYLLENGIKPFIVFSGSKGFHMNLFFKEANLLDITNLNQSLATIFKRKLNLEFLDFNIYHNGGMQRVPYSIHERTGLITTPIFMDILYDDFINKVSRNKLEVTEFSMDDYYVPDNFRDSLIKLDSENIEKNKEYKYHWDRLQKLRKNNQTTNNYKGDKSLIFKDMRELCKVLIGEPAREYEHYNSYICPFHDDHNPSALVYSKRFICKSCNLNLNYFDFLRKFFKLESDDEVKKKMKELIK